MPPRNSRSSPRRGASNRSNPQNRGPGRGQFSGHGHDVSPRDYSSPPRQTPSHGIGLELRPTNIPGDGSPRGERARGRGRGVIEDMTDYPRQADTTSTQVTEETRKPRGMAGDTIEVSDVHNLLAAIWKLESRDKLQVPADRSTKSQQVVHDPLHSPTHQTWRVARILDGIAALLVSKARHEVIATALRVDGRNKTIEFMVAANEDVPDATSTHITWMWSILCRVSSRYHELYAIPEDENTPPQKTKDPQIMQYLFEFKRKCIKFSFAKLQKRVNGRFRAFSDTIVKEFESRDGHPFQQVFRPILILEMMFMREEGATCGLPADEDEVNWTRLLSLLRVSRKQVREFLSGGGFTPDDLLRAARFPKWETYLRKITSIMDDIDALIRAAFSPQCKQLFTMTFQLKTIPQISTRVNVVPTTAGEWEEILEKAVSHFNYQGRQLEEFEPKVINTPVVNRDTGYMAQRVIGRDLVMHCEVKLLLHIARSESLSPRPARAYSYIGVSKLSCRGCHAFIQAYNKTCGKQFVTKGSHGKSYWPWQYPRNFPSSDETGRVMYGMLAQKWANSYNGYVTERVPLGPDSTAASQDTQPSTSEEEIEDMENLKLMTEMLNL